MAQTGKNKLRRWEFPAGSGINIRELINRWKGADRGVSYRVTVPARVGGERRFKQCSTVEAAEAWATEEFKGFQKEGHKHFEFTPVHREDAVAALRVLTGLGLTLKAAALLAKKHHQTPGGNLTVQEVVDALIAEKETANLRSRSVGDLRVRLKIFCQTFGERLVKEVTQLEIEKWVSELRGISDKSAEELSPRSKKNYLVTVRTLFNYAIAKGYRTAENPASKISTPKIDWEQPSILSVAQAKKLLTTAETEQDGKLLAPVVIGLFAGIRSNEIMRLDWSALDLDEGILTIGPQIAKKRRLRVLELTPNSIAWLKTVAKKEGPVAPAKFSRRWTKLVKKAGFPNWGDEQANAMRHSFGSYHYALHSDAAKTAAMLGHKANDQVLFDSYRSLARKKDGEAYFGIRPT